MATAPPPTTRPRQSRRAPTPPAPRWRRWLLLGLFFGLGYGLTQRLLEVPWGEGSSTRVPAFSPKGSPAGTSLEDLRRQKGENAKPLAADLEELARRQREEKEKREAAKARDAEQKDAALEEEKTRLETDRRRLEELGTNLEPPKPEPAPPVAPTLPPPAPMPLESAPPAAQIPSDVPSAPGSPP